MFGFLETWVHASAPDIALQVLRVQWRGPQYWKVKAKLVNQHNGLYYETATYTIHKKHFRFWRRAR